MLCWGLTDGITVSCGYTVSVSIKLPPSLFLVPDDSHSMTNDVVGLSVRAAVVYRVMLSRFG